MLFKIIKQLQDTSSTNEKLVIMQENKDNELFKEYMRLATCPSINFYITEKTFPKRNEYGFYDGGFGFTEISKSTIESWTKPFYSRTVTGDYAKTRIKSNLIDLSPRWQELYGMLLLKDIKAKIGVTLVNKVWPNLCVSVPYQRCSLPDEKTLTKFKTGEGFIVQTKGDGMFASLVLEPSQWSEDVKLFTRNGNKFPQHFAEYIADGLNDMNAVYEGELLCFRNSELLSRKEGNGILNSVMQGGELPSGVSVQYHVWNRLPHEDWKVGKTNKTYGECFKDVCKSWSESPATRLELVDYLHVETLEQAYSFNKKQLEAGLEGSIIKTLTHKWKDGTSKECVKFKLAVEIDLEVVDIEEATGKDAGCAGNIIAKSSCGAVVTGVNCNGEQKDRRHIFNNKHEYVGKIFTCIANELLDKDGSATISLFLARSDLYNEVRNDKTQADSLERIQQIFNAAKHIS